MEIKITTQSGRAYESSTGDYNQRVHSDAPKERRVTAALENINKKIIMKNIFKTFLTFIAAFILFCCLRTAAYALSDPNTHAIEDVKFTIVSPHGYGLIVRRVGPKLSKYSDKKFPTLLRIGGGWGNSTFLLDNKFAKMAAAAGIIVVAFDSELKRKEKAGSPLLDYNGFRDQDDAAAILKFIIEHPNVDKDRIGVWSHSNGITLAAGVLGREKYRDLNEQVLFLLDDEGPHCPQDLLQDQDIHFHTAGIKDTWSKVITAKVGQGKAYGSENEFFRERCAVNFIAGYGGIYQRIQARNDHETGFYHGHAAAMLNAAANGRAKWTRLNKQPRNRKYGSSGPADGANIDTVLDVEKIAGPNDKRLWDIAAELFERQ